MRNETPSVRPDAADAAAPISIPPRPPRCEVAVENIPTELRERPQWVGWRYVWKGNDWTKAPTRARGGSGSTSDPKTWATFDEALAAYLQHADWAGIGYVFAADDPYAGIDLDDCIDETGRISDEAQAIIDACGSYSEISPSGTGVKVFVRGRKTISDSKGGPFPGIKQIEVYDRGRYFTVTGRKVDGAPMECRDAQAELDRLGEKIRALKGRWSKPNTSTNWKANTHQPLARPDDASVRLRASKYLAAIPDAIMGQDGSKPTYTAAVALVHGFCLSEEEALDLLMREYNPRCRPMWSEEELRHKVSDAATKEHDKPRGWLRDSASREPIDIEAVWPSNPALLRTVMGGSAGLSSAIALTDADGDATSTEAATSTSSLDASQQVILLDVDEHRAVTETVAALAHDEGLYQRGRVLVRIARQCSSDDGIRRSSAAPAIEVLPTASLRERLTMNAHYVKRGKNGLASVHPTQWLVNGVAARGEYPGIRLLNAISEVPILRPDGSLCQKPGYDARTGVLYEPSGEFPEVPADVSLDDADAAAAELLDVVCDFTFEDDCHRSAWLAGLLTPLARVAFDGPAPLFLIDANTRGAGKTLLGQIIGLLCLGRDMPASSYSHDTEELRKKVTAIALAGDRMVQLDNLEGTFGNDTLDRALTATTWRDRLLGKSEMVEMPLQAVWYATGNNVAVAADTARRVIHIRLDVLDQRPEDRQGFKHPDLLGWVRDNRAPLLIHALTILRAYCRAGRPSQNLRPMGSFEGWSDLVRQAVVWVGLPDPCKSRDRLAEQADTSHEALSQVIEAWETYDHKRVGLVMANLMTELYRPNSQPMDAASVQMRAALETLVGCPTGRPPTARQVGNKLRHFRRRVIDGRYLDSQGSSRSGTVWRVGGNDPDLPV